MFVYKITTLLLTLHFSISQVEAKNQSITEFISCYFGSYDKIIRFSMLHNSVNNFFIPSGHSWSLVATPLSFKIRGLFIRKRSMEKKIKSNHVALLEAIIIDTIMKRR